MGSLPDSRQAESDMATAVTSSAAQCPQYSGFGYVSSRSVLNSSRLEHQCFYVPLRWGDDEVQLTAKAFEKVVLLASPWSHLKIVLALQVGLINDGTIEVALQRVAKFIHRGVFDGDTTETIDRN